MHSGAISAGLFNDDTTRTAYWAGNLGGKFMNHYGKEEEFQEEEEEAKPKFAHRNQTCELQL